MLLYALTISLSAFLLFEVQPIIAKMILPWFGGSSAVWSTCMLFFQIVLLLGYGYAHWLHSKLAARKQALVHIAVLAISLATLPIIPGEHWKSANVGQPSLTILALLAVTVGLPYFLLSSTSPLLQAWYARSHKGGLPYRLFALSNLASMTALLTYPFLVEPNLPSHMQGILWSGGFVCFALLCGLTAWRSSSLAAVPEFADAPMEEEDPPPSFALRLLWLGLAAAASILLLAVTTHLTQDVAAIPFLWIVPLAVYLLSFIICFESPRFYRRGVFVPLLIAALGFMAFRLWVDHVDWEVKFFGMRMTLRLVIGLLALALFICCMVCHGELVRIKPHPRYLTGFYVIVSLGGAVGGLFVGLAAPYVFHAYWEFPIGLVFCALLAFLVFSRELWKKSGTVKLAGIASLAVLLLAYSWFLRGIMHRMVADYRVVARNFYGQLRTKDEGDPSVDEDACRKLVHGVINHGEQMKLEKYRRLPVTYFCPQSGIGRGMRAQEGQPRKIAILGLGCGTLAAYGRAGDILRIYEINPLVPEIAQSEFTYLKDTPAKVEIVLGDGRLRIEAEPPDQLFDMLVMDAFSGDSVPVHLITREAFGIYFRHLKPNGILAVNISNTYLNLEPVMERAASAYGKVALAYHFTPEDDDILCFGCSWTLIMDRPTLDTHPDLLKDAKVLKQERPFRIWTDEFSNMFSILK